MKTAVTTEELNAAVVLLTGVGVSTVREIHIAAGVVTTVYGKAGDGEEVTYEVNLAAIRDSAGEQDSGEKEEVGDVDRTA